MRVTERERLAHRVAALELELARVRARLEEAGGVTPSEAVRVADRVAELLRVTAVPMTSMS